MSSLMASDYDTANLIRTTHSALPLSRRCWLPAAALHATVYVSADLARADHRRTRRRLRARRRLEAQWLEGRRSIETLVTLEVETYAKGDLGRTVTLRVPGGQMGPYRSVMLGAPTFVEGEEVVVFLAASWPRHPAPGRPGAGRLPRADRRRDRRATGDAGDRPDARNRVGRAGARRARRRQHGGPRRLPRSCRKCARWPGGRGERRPRRSRPAARAGADRGACMRPRTRT